MARDHEIGRGPEHQQNPGEHFERGRPELAGHDFMHGMKDVMHHEQRMFRQMEQNLIRDGILPPNPFLNNQDQDCADDQQQQQPQKEKSGGGIFGFVKDVVKEVAPIAALL